MKSSAEVEEAEVHSRNHTLCKLWKPWKGMIIIPNRTFLVRFGSISGEFGRAMVPMARPNEPDHDMLPKRTKKGAIRYLPYPNSS